MRGINYRQLLSAWDIIIDKLCEECTPHDVLGVVKKHLESSAAVAKKSGLNYENINDAIKNLDKAMKNINPES